MNIHDINKKIRLICLSTLTICLSHTVAGQKIRSYYGVVIDKDMSDFLTEAVIPFANYAFDLSYEKSGVKSALFLNELSENATGYEEGFLPDDYKANKSRGQIHMITLTTTRHIKGFGLWCFDSQSYAVVDDTKVFIGSYTDDIVAKRTSSLPVYKLKKPEDLYEYDPTMLAVFKVDSMYKFYIAPRTLEYYEDVYERKYPQDTVNCDTTRVQIANLAREFDPFLRECHNDSFIYRINRKDIHSVQITMIPKRWSSIFDVSDYYQVSSNDTSSNSEEKRPSIFIHKSLIPAMGNLTDKRLTMLVPRNIPSFVRYIDFPKTIFELDEYGCSSLK